MDEIHSYENFLAAHDPELRRSLGVFYTPQPAVSYIVRAVDDILRQDFDLCDGIADKTKIDIDGKEFHRVQILDPATGVGTFLLEVIEQIYQRIKDKYGLDAWQRYVSEHLLPRLHGFEVMKTPYEIAHQKLTEFLQDTGYQLGKHQRFNIHLKTDIRRLSCSIGRLKTVCMVRRIVFMAKTSMRAATIEERFGRT